MFNFSPTHSQCSGKLINFVQIAIALLSYYCLTHYSKITHVARATNNLIDENIYDLIVYQSNAVGNLSTLRERPLRCYYQPNA